MTSFAWGTQAGTGPEAEKLPSYSNLASMWNVQDESPETELNRSVQTLMRRNSGCWFKAKGPWILFHSINITNYETFKCHCIKQGHILLIEFSTWAKCHRAIMFYHLFCQYFSPTETQSSATPAGNVWAGAPLELVTTPAVHTVTPKTVKVGGLELQISPYI